MWKRPCLCRVACPRPQLNLHRPPGLLLQTGHSKFFDLKASKWHQKCVSWNRALVTCKLSLQTKAPEMCQLEVAMVTRMAPSATCFELSATPAGNQSCSTTMVSTVCAVLAVRISSCTCHHTWHLGLRGPKRYLEQLFCITSAADC